MLTTHPGAVRDPATNAAPYGGCAPAAECTTAATLASVPALRRFARAATARWSLTPAVGEALALVVSELAGNAVRHSGSADVTLRLSATATTLIVEVRDHGHWRHPSRLPSHEPACGGRGLQLVEAYSARCTIHPAPDGTRVTVELPLHR
ncbi:ATP-binding protein [Kitasatospora sp. NPDC002227]|uniref:ATP-binding protein n=1 Tax=Kitasatospora sp. NPDC002227 TaxID=3154773 RepID=UPI0033190691